MKIVVRTNGGNQIGLGHLNRCMNLVDEFKNTIGDAQVKFVVNDECIKLAQSRSFECLVSNEFDDFDIIQNEKPNLIIFDSYIASDRYIKSLQDIATTIMFDDNNDIYKCYPEYVINGNIYADSIDYKSQDTEFLLGHRYLVLNKAYKYCDIETKKDGIIISTGGADPQNLMVHFIKALKNLKVLKKVVIGPSFTKYQIEEIEDLVSGDSCFKLIYKPSNLKEYINSSKLMISACGASVYEALTLNTNVLAYSLASNQNNLLKSLNRCGVVTLGSYNEIDFESLKCTVENALNNQPSNELFDLFDGRGSENVANKILYDLGCDIYEQKI